MRTLPDENRTKGHILRLFAAKEAEQAAAMAAAAVAAAAAAAAAVTIIEKRRELTVEEEDVMLDALFAKEDIYAAVVARIGENG